MALTCDLIMRDQAWITGLGNIIGNSHLFEFSPTLTCIPTPSSFVPTGQVNFITSTPVTGSLHSAQWSHDGQFVAIGIETGSGTTGDPLQIYKFNGTSLSLVYASPMGGSAAGNVTVYTTQWHPTKNVIAVGTSQSSNSTTYPELQVFTWDPIAFTLTQISAIPQGCDVRGVNWYPCVKFNRWT